MRSLSAGAAAAGLALGSCVDIGGLEATYQMSWPGGRKRVTKMSDFEVARDPACERQRRAPADWSLLRARVGDCLAALSASENGRGIGCAHSVGRVQQAAAGVLDIDTRYSSWRNDCYLGTVAALACDVVCSMQQALAGVSVEVTEWTVKWHKMQLELEGINFYVELPWSTILLGQWHIPGLFSRMGEALRALGEVTNTVGGVVVANRCDSADSEADAEFLKHAGAGGVLPLGLAERFIQEQGSSSLTLRRCPFGFAAALLSVALGLLLNGNQHASGGRIGGFSPEILVNSHAQQLVRSWEEVTPQFFFDMLTTHWRLFDILDLLALRWGPDAGPEAFALISASHGGPVIAWTPAGLQQVLFLGGGETTFQWGSFTVRGRQVARGLRTLGVDARAWNSPCEAWCEHARAASQHGDPWMPSAIIHVKFICECALKGWRRGAVHLYDPIDVFRMPDVNVDAVLVQTTLALGDLQEHPPLRAARVVPHVVWLPLHHSNSRSVRIDVTEPVRHVGTHTVHRDDQLQSLIEGLLEGSEAEYVHLDPGLLFAYAEGRVSTPQQTDLLYQQMSTLHVGVVKQSGCLSEWWFCSRWKTGQRLVNLLSVGVPAIVWGDAQGHLDVVEGRWPLEGCVWKPGRHGCGALPGHGAAKPLRYPAELVVRGDSDVPAALALLLRNVTLRRQASNIGLQLADHFSLLSVSRRLFRLLVALARERLPRRCRVERHRFARTLRGRRGTRGRWRQMRFCR